MLRSSRIDIRTLAVILLMTALLAAACSSPSEAPSALSDQGAIPPSPGPTTIEASIVGTWERETSCEELVSALTDAGLEGWVLESVAGNGFVPGVSTPDQIADPTKPCDGAVPRTHSHFFTEDGLFGSLDWNGEQVDDGTYELVGEDTFVVSKEFPDVTFHYTIDGDEIGLEPVIPDCSPDCFEAAWSVSVAYPGETWRRVAPAGAAGTEESPGVAQVDPLVGEWARTLQCPELLAAFEDAGLEAYVPDMVWSSFFWPEPENFEDFVFHAKDPCKDAQPRVHSHFFTAEGEFGSKDEHGQEVDFGTYEIVGKHRLMINDVLFRYRIRGDAITFDPLTPDCTPCFAHAWSIAVASPGGEWERVA